jgi:hypothetical protein
MYIKLAMLLKDHGYKVLAALLCVMLAGGMYLKWRGDLIESGFKECTTERDAIDNDANMQVIEEYKLRAHQYSIEKEKLENALAIYATAEPIVRDRVRVRIQKEACDYGDSETRNESTGLGQTKSFFETELSERTSERLNAMSQAIRDGQQLALECALKMEANQNGQF